MAGDNEQHPSFIREPIKTVKWWFVEANTTNRGGLGIALAAIFLGSLLTAVGSLVIKAVGPSGNVPGWIAVLIGGVCLVVGIAIAWALTRKFYEVFLQKEHAEEEALEAKLNLAEERLATLAPHELTVQRFNVYIQHLYRLAGELRDGSLSLDDLTSEDVKRSFCGLTQTTLETATGHQYKASIWREPEDGGLLDRWADKAPKQVGDLMSSRTTFEILSAPDHSQNEIESLRARIDPSWLKHNQRQEEDTAREKLYRADAEHIDALRGGDIEAFTNLGYQSVRAFAFRRSSLLGYFVLVSQTQQAFSELEDGFLLWLKRLLELEIVPSDSGQQTTSPAG